VARIAGVDLPREKRVEAALPYIYGIGLHTSQQLLERTNVNPDTRVRDLTDDEVNRFVRSSIKRCESKGICAGKSR
jgi:small subunit ribosomal protein S13